MRNTVPWGTTLSGTRGASCATIVIQKRTISSAARQIQGRNVRVDIGISLTMEFLPDWRGGSKKLLSARLSTDGYAALFASQSGSGHGQQIDLQSLRVQSLNRRGRTFPGRRQNTHRAILAQFLSPVQTAIRERENLLVADSARIVGKPGK